MNPDADIISLEPIESHIRSKIGYVIHPNNISEVLKTIENLENDESIQEQIKQIRSKTVFNIGKSAHIGAEHIEEILNQQKFNDISKNDI